MSKKTRTFYDLGLTDETASKLKELGYEEPTPIQEQTIPAILMQRNILGCAETGTGKSAAFLLPMIDILAHARRVRARMPRAMILESTRELALQLQNKFNSYAQHTDLVSALLIGGVGSHQQEQSLYRGVDVLIATPGRLIDHIKNGKIILKDVCFFVIDEADRMLDMGFIPDVQEILSLLPKNIQNLMFSATMPPDIQKLAEEHISNPKNVFVSPQSSISANITQELIEVSSVQEKFTYLLKLIKSEPISNALIFCNRKKDVDILGNKLVNKNINCAILHGGMNQHVRMDCLERFRNGEIRFLVCSDVAARGLDIPNVSHIFNVDVPEQAEDYVHRIGRTGRAGRKGQSFTFALPDDHLLIEKISELPGATISNKMKKNNKVISSKPTKKRDNTPSFIQVMEPHHEAFGLSDQVPSFLKSPSHKSNAK